MKGKTAFTASTSVHSRFYLGYAFDSNQIDFAGKSNFLIAWYAQFYVDTSQILDTGTTNHMYFKKSNFTSLQPLHKYISVGFLDGATFA